MLIQLVEGDTIDVNIPISSLEEAPCRADILYDVVADRRQKLPIIFGQASAMIYFGDRHWDEIELAKIGVSHGSLRNGKMKSEDDAPRVASALSKGIRSADSE